MDKLIKKNGRPLAFKSPKELEIKIQDYFDWCDNAYKQVVDKETGEEKLVSAPKPYTMSGLAYALGVDRMTLINYAKITTLKNYRENNFKTHCQTDFTSVFFSKKTPFISLNLKLSKKICHVN